MTINFKKKKGDAAPQVTVNKAPATVAAPLENGVPTIKDLIAPASFRREAFDYLGVGSKYVRSFLLSGFPKDIAVRWADSLYNYDGDLDMAIHINPMDERAAMDELTDKITQFEAQLDLESEKGSNRNVTRLRNQVVELYREREKIEQNYISMFGVQMIVNLYANSLDQLDKETQMLENSLRGQKIKLMPLHLRQDQGYKSGLPFGKTWLPKNFRNFSSEGLTACFPFYNAEISHPSGTFLGVNLQTQTPIYVDFYDRKILSNGNTTIIGQAGSGKTFLVSLLTMRSALQGVRSVIIDPEGEYGNITKAMGGTIIKVAPGSRTIPNPFDLEDEEEVDGDGTPTGRLYTDDVILNEKGEFVHHGQKRRMPTFSDFHRKLGEVAKVPGNETLNSIANALRMFTKDGVYGMFDCETDESVANYKDSPVICFDVKGLEENVLRPIGMYIALSWAWDKFAKKNPKIKKRIVCDEAWMLTNPNMSGYQYTADFLQTCARRARKRNCALLCASQNFKEFVSCPQGEAVLTNAVVNIFLKQASTDIDALQDKFKLSNGERSYLLSPRKGHFLLKMASEGTVGFAYSTDYEKYLIERHTIADRSL